MDHINHTQDPIVDTNASLSASTPNIGLSVSLAVLAIVGCFGNLLMILTISSFSRTFGKISHLHMLLRSINDLAVCIIIMPFQAYTIWIDSGPPGCGFIGILDLFTVVLSSLYLSAIALNRFCLLKLPAHTYYKCFSPKRVYMIVPGLVLISLTSVIPALCGALTPGYDALYSMCSATASSQDVNSQQLYFITLLFVCIYGIPPFIIVTMCYFGIWRIFRKSGRKVLQHISSRPMAQRNLVQARLTRNLFILTVFFGVCWIPCLVVNMVDAKGHVGALGYEITITMCYLHSVLHPWVCAGLLRPYREAYRDILMCRFDMFKRQPLTKVEPVKSISQ